MIQIFEDQHRKVIGFFRTLFRLEIFSGEHGVWRIIYKFSAAYWDKYLSTKDKS